MNCANHPEVAAVAFCRSCGKALCEACQRPAQGTIFCDEHAPAGATAAGVSGTTVNAPPPPPGATPYSPYTSPYYAGAMDPGVSPGLAFLLGLIPGVGAIYNGQYAKGIVHVIILGLLISIISSGAAAGFEPLFGFLIPLWFFYMAFEAYHTARKRQRGEAVDEFSSILPLHSTGGFPIGPVLLIAFGVIFLLNTLDIIRFYQLVRWWPLFLIVLGVYMLVVRLMATRAPAPVTTREATDES